MKEASSMEEQKQPPAGGGGGGGWRSSLFIIGVEVAERFAFSGVSGNLIMYLTREMGETTATAAKNVNVWTGVATILPLFGAFIADSYLGRFRTILLASLIYLLGLAIITVTVAVIHGRFLELLFFISLYLVAIGEGGHRPCVQTFGADQFDEESEEEKRAKNSFFNWWYFGLCSGYSTATLIVFYLQDNVGWAVGFGVPGISMAFALVLFLLGRRLYRRQSPTGSPFTRVAQVLVAAARKSHLPSKISNSRQETVDGLSHIEMSVDPQRRTLAHTNQFRFLDKATIIDEIDASSGSKNRWRLCSNNQVEEVKLLIRLIPIWASCLMYTVVHTQTRTFFVKQCSTVNRKIGSSFVIPSASLQVAIGLVAIFIVPIYDQAIVPIARRFTGVSSGLTMLQRIGVGMFLSVITMVVAALVEMKRLRIARQNGLLDLPNAIVPLSVWWMLPQFIMFGIADVFSLVGMQEFFYDQMPDSLRSIGTASYLSVFGVGSFLSSGLISIVEEVSSGWLVDNLNRARLDCYYWLLAGLSTVWFGLFVGVAKWFLYKKIDGAPS